jgi:uncharacterized membrane protein
MIVSLEAILLSAFVMISQNRADEKRVAIANEAWRTVQNEGTQTEQLLDLSRQILALTEEPHRHGARAANGVSPGRPERGVHGDER